MIYTCKPEKIALYINNGRKSIDAIRAETGADVIINGGLYTMASWTPVCHLKADGTVYASDPWTYFGYGWESGTANLRLVSDYSNLDNYICCVCLLRNGKKEGLLYPAEMGGSRPRTALGVYPDGRIMFYAESTPKTPEGLQTMFQSMGLDSAIMMDGGGSTQGISPDGAYRQSRIVHNYILGYLKKNQKPRCPYAEPSGLIYRGACGDAARWLQWHLNQHGYNLAVDGIYGGKTYAAVTTFQTTHKLIADGIVGDLTKKRLKEYDHGEAPEIITPAYVWNGNLSTIVQPMRYIILHHAGVSSSTVEAIHNYHKSLGWAGIGYNMYVRKDGTIYMGRPLGKIGAHTVGYNNCSVGICCEGNFETEYMGAVQLEALKKAIRYVKSYYPDAAIKQHKDFAATACAGRNFPFNEVKNL